MVTIKVRTLEKESSRARKKKENGLDTIEGIAKEVSEEDEWCVDGAQVIKP